MESKSKRFVGERVERVSAIVGLADSDTVVEFEFETEEGRFQSFAVSNVDAFRAALNSLELTRSNQLEGAIFKLYLSEGTNTVIERVESVFEPHVVLEVE